MKQIPAPAGAARGDGDRGDDDRKGKFRTLNASLHGSLRNEILDGRLEPGDKLRFDHLRRRYAVTVGPLREAMMRLASEGLVVLEEHKGFRVAPVSRTQLEDITLARCGIEPLAIQRSIALGGARWVDGVAVAFDALSASPMRTSADTLDEAWEERHRAFHASLYAACDSTWLSRFCGLLYDQTERYRRLWFRRFGQTRDALDEHHELAAAVISRDAAAAGLCFRRHVSRTAASLLTVLPEAPTGPVGPRHGVSANFLMGGAIE